MRDLVQLGSSQQKPLKTPEQKSGLRARRPEWMRVKIQDSKTYKDVDKLLDGLELHTVCEEARCPNIWECWGKHRTATFLILGDICTRNCRYCAITKGRPKPPDPEEPEKVARAVAHLGLAHAVVTSVERDDLPDYGSSHFAQTVAAIRAQNAKIRIEVLTPDFMGDTAALERVLRSGPDVYNHNTETVPRLFPRMRAKGNFQRSMELLGRVDAYRREHKSSMITKSGMMVGLGETIDEVLAVMDALRAVNCDVLTIGQYLNPTVKHAPIDRYYAPEEFAEIEKAAKARGFAHVEAGPLVRSSYHAASHVPEKT
ncbi:MAG: lipoyl synthase [Deltaproteobacteria bacterium RIFOXYA12_FULL_58_15]|nr:MAG: lipoyl synthase [Deltaproteobacteria bacterium RIFOXYA12_FULL_58_15]OGR14136.1 MAG: lipoyl synthase [Deltaproteobacteria bacterium RIFOXYB12_FULL_58_9]